MFNPLFINPAYAGSREAISTVLMHRSQWVGFEGAPLTQTLTIHAPLAQKKMGIGVSVLRDQIGPSTSYGFMGNYAYRVPLKRGKLSFGLRACVYSFFVDPSKISYKEQEENTNAVAVSAKSWSPSFDFGLRYHTNKAYAGLALSHINHMGKSWSSDSLSNTSYRLSPEIRVMAGYAWIINDDLVFKPSFLTNISSSRSMVSDVNASFLVNHVFWVGCNYRTNRTLAGMFQMDINQAFSFGYSYDFSLSKLRNFQAGSHELFLRFEFDYKKSRILSPRYF